MRRQLVQHLAIVLIAGLLTAACGSAPVATQVPPTATPATVPTTAVPATTQTSPVPTQVPPPSPSAVPTEVLPTSPPPATPLPSVPTATDEPSTELVLFRVVREESEASYEVQEVLLGQKTTTVGRTNALEGEFRLGLRDGKPYFDFSRLRVDLRTLKSDNGIRDQAIRQRWLESNRYPFAEFVAREIVEFPGDAAEGKEVRFQVNGDMTIREITRPVTFEIRATLNGDTLTGTGTTFLLMKDFGFDPPEILGRFTVSDGVTVTVKGVAKRATS
ncbi:MAG: YceI family protein [Anaerolineae bacterium]|nr:YceI family protein [Anaerolineae bacterium]